MGLWSSTWSEETIYINLWDGSFREALLGQISFSSASLCIDNIER